MKKKLLCAALCLCLLLTLLPAPVQAAGLSIGARLKVGGTSLVEGGEVKSGGKTTGASYDLASNTLTLTDYDGGAIEANDMVAGTVGLTINLVRDNTVTAAEENGVRVDGGSLTIRGSGSLRAVGGSSVSDTCGIRAEDYALTIENCTVTAVGGSSAASASGIKALAVTIENSTVTATGGTSTENDASGIKADFVTIENSTVTATGGTAQGSAQGSANGIQSNSIAITDSTVFAAGGTITDSTVFAAGGTSINGSVAALGFGREDVPTWLIYTRGYYWAAGGSPLTTANYIYVAGKTTVNDWKGGKYQRYVNLVSVPAEQFTGLIPGGTYWFDLSAQGIATAGVAAAVNPALPDADLHYVPFTYAGTVNAYVLNAASSGGSRSSELAAGTTDSTNAVGHTYVHSLFVADYAVTHKVSWGELNTAGLIFGKDYASGGVNYTLRAPSVGSDHTGSASDGSDHIGTPSTNEWDAMLNKSENIQNLNANDGIFLWGQDTAASAAGQRTHRGKTGAASSTPSANQDYYGFRPVLEVPGTLSANALKAVALKLNGGKLTTGAAYAGAEITEMNIAYTGDSFTAPANDGFARPDGNTGTYFRWLGSNGRLYAPGASVPATVTSLTAQWTASAPVYSAPGYRVSDGTAKDAGGSVTISAATAASGATITVTPKAEPGYRFTGLSFTDAAGNSVPLIFNGDGTYSFIMPPRGVTVRASFEKGRFYADVPEGAWYADAAWYLAKEGLMSGTGEYTFSPKAPLTRQALWMMLARMAGAKPADMAAARAWAVENKISDGAAAKTVLTRQQAVAMLYRFAILRGMDAVTLAEYLGGFADAEAIAAYAVAPLNWAVGRGVVEGDGGLLNPGKTLTRAQGAAILYRFVQLGK